MLIRKGYVQITLEITCHPDWVVLTGPKGQALWRSPSGEPSPKAGLWAADGPDNMKY